MAIRDLILAADDLPFEDFTVAAWGGIKVRVRALMACERDQFEIESQLEKGKDERTNDRNVRARLVVKSLVDPETGERIFTDVDALGVGKKNGAVIDTLFWSARKLSKFSDEDLDSLIKNCAPSRADALSGASA